MGSSRWNGWSVVDGQQQVRKGRGKGDFYYCKSAFRMILLGCSSNRLTVTLKT